MGKTLVFCEVFGMKMFACVQQLAQKTIRCELLYIQRKTFFAFQTAYSTLHLLGRFKRRESRNFQTIFVQVKEIF
jgi:hypothetical protein